MDNKALVILGPTASGKTSLALQLSKCANIEIISLDSALVYRGMDIGTAKPSAEELSACPHHLINIIDPAQSYSAADFRSDCIRLVREICGRGKLPVICGGTMMYYKALCEGLSPLPPTDDKIRASIAEEASLYGWPYMHEKLKKLDPSLYTKLSPNDKQRISRALEVIRISGRSMSSFFEKKGDQCPFKRIEVVLLPQAGREELRLEIRRRFMRMLDRGFENEVRALNERGDLSLSMPSMRCVGYRQMWEYLDGKTNFGVMTERSIIATCHLAKHQMTWLRGGLSKSVTVKRINMVPGDATNLATVCALAEQLQEYE